MSILLNRINNKCSNSHALSHIPFGHQKEPLPLNSEQSMRRSLRSTCFHFRDNYYLNNYSIIDIIIINIITVTIIISIDIIFFITVSGLWDSTYNSTSIWLRCSCVANSHEECSEISSDCSFPERINFGHILHFSLLRQTDAYTHQ